jgi:nucleolar protein 12
VRQEKRQRNDRKSRPLEVVESKPDYESNLEATSEQDSSEESSNDSVASDDSSSSDTPSGQQDEVEKPQKRIRKRKRDEEDDSIERQALQRLANYEKDLVDEDTTKLNGLGEDISKPSQVDIELDEDESEDEDEEQSFENAIPQHESLAKGDDNPEMDKASRTVFLGNVSIEAILSKSAKKTLLKHLASFISELPPSDPPHKVESIRFRSTAFDSKLPKKAAFVKRELMDATTHNTNAYAVYTTKVACREASKRLNGTVVLDRHLRVDQIAHPAKTDHKRCVFIGNLDFVDDDSKIREEAEDHKKKKSKTRQPADVEEGLWREFSKAGKVESVRVVRDQKTRVGKGFAYVQFLVSISLAVDSSD